jgi:hypothetical protein
LWDSLGDFILWLVKVAAWTVIGAIALVAIFWLTLLAATVGMALWERFTRWRREHFPPDEGTWRDR